MTWEALIAIAVRDGLPLALNLFDKWSTKKNEVPTVAEIEELNALSAQTSRSQMLEALARAGIDPDSEPGKRLLG